MMLSGLAPHASKLKYLLNENSTTILTALGVGGTIATAVLTGRATFKAADLIAEEKLILDTTTEVSDLAPVELSKTEKTKLVWSLYVPPVAMGILTVTSIIFANKISSKRIAALTIAGGISERAFQEYKDKVVEKLGMRQDEKLRDEIAQDRVNANPASGREVLIVGTGDVLCYDMLTGRYFQSTMEDIKRAENKVNYELIHFMSCSLSHFYDEIGLPPTPYTDSVGWNMNNHMEVKFSTVFSTDNRPCIAIDFSRAPIPNFEKHWE
jgi:Family of unknown function (DUF6353)